jgi:hypothetical protein
MRSQENVTNTLGELLDVFSSIDILNTYQYQAPSQNDIDLPSNIRLDLRQRKASLL